MRGVARFLRWLSAAALLIVLLLLAWNCINIYANAAVQQSSASIPGAQAMYQADDVRQRLKAVAVPCLALLGLVAVNSVVLAAMPSARTHQDTRRTAVKYEALVPRDPGWVRVGLLLAAIVLITLGVLNGGLYDVFVKAINICTECIGLG